MSKVIRALLGSFLSLTITSTAFAGDMGMGQARLFLGAAPVDPKDVNAALTAQSMKNIKTSNQYGLEITFQTLQYLQLGLRYSHHYISQDEDPSNEATDYKTDMSQDAMMGVARVPLMKTDYMKLDVFAAAGINSTVATLKTASVDGKLEKTGSPYYTAGASVAFGYKQYYLFFEGGYEGNKVDDLKPSGNMPNPVTSIDLSGSYFLVGFMFDGIPIFSK